MNYPWYEIVIGDELKQGDILVDCPVFDLQIQQDESKLLDPQKDYDLDYKYIDTIVISQSCDLDKPNEKIQQVALCSLWNKSQFTSGKFSKNSDWEETRKGKQPAFHVLNQCNDSNCNVNGHHIIEREFSIVDFRTIHSLPINMCREIASRAGRRLRLLPPYREHLSQAFARFFMRVGLPQDIPSFTKRTP